ncbi:hypothetical protein BJ165DRAFT_242673 [Panaeolus papilionaceus]|nr:hypothetical protein BJ165DRAFT_242673 [Panaeolus papilionaceus]
MSFNRVLDFLTSSWYVILFHLYLLKINSFPSLPFPSLPFPSLPISSPSTTPSPQTLLTNFDHPNFFHQLDFYTFLYAYRQTAILIPPWSCFLRAGTMVEVKGNCSFPTIKIPHTFSIVYEAIHDNRWNKSWSPVRMPQYIDEKIDILMVRHDHRISDAHLHALR